MMPAHAHIGNGMPSERGTFASVIRRLLSRDMRGLRQNADLQFTPGVANWLISKLRAPSRLECGTFFGQR